MSADAITSWLAGAVLTGGESRRMGRDKATMAIDGRPMAAIVASALADAGCHPVVAVGGSSDELATTGLAVVADGRSGVGPARGVLGALDHFAATGGVVTHVAVVACDLPLIDATTLAPLVAEAAAVPGLDVVVATTGGRLEPTVAIWSLAARHRVAAAVAGGVSALHLVIERLHAGAVPVDPAALLNVNRPADVPDASRRRPLYPGST